MATNRCADSDGAPSHAPQRARDRATRAVASSRRPSSSRRPAWNSWLRCRLWGSHMAPDARQSASCRWLHASDAAGFSCSSSRPALASIREASSGLHESGIPDQARSTCSSRPAPRTGLKPLPSAFRASQARSSSNTSASISTISGRALHS